ncbi:MAG TPA: DUF4159 domain-containing protein [Vicinamibacterales bacterium]|nr:DUF4159 domain-containing protein [Vicinamibacterales bacterium]
MTRAVVATLLVVGLGAGTALAQRRGGYGGGMRFGGGSGAPIAPNLPYDGRFTFIRLRYGPPIPYQTQRVGWSHDYPEGEQHFTKILNELSYLGARVEQSNVMALDDPELSRYPVAYMCEPGRWQMTDDEAAKFRAYLLKGGFVFFDDYRGPYDWNNFELQMRRVLPEGQWLDLELSNPVYHVFFEIKTLDVPQYYDRGAASFRAIYEDNDPTKRIVALANFNTDISEYWEWSDTGLKPIDESNEAYKIGVNYIIYGMTH